MTDNTLEKIHGLYQTAVQKSHDIIGIVNSLYELLNSYTPPEEDTQEYDSLLRCLETSRQSRKRTFLITNLVMDIAYTIMFIVLWLNHSKAIDIDINLTGRRKSLESELTKFLRKAEVHDLFGLRGIILNNNSAKDSEVKLFALAKHLTAILTKSSRKDYKEFKEWLEATKIDAFSKERIYATLKLPLKIEIFKDYVNSPKSNDYQSLHYVFSVEMYSEVLPGVEFELQLRTIYMHKTAINGSASHKDYKQEIDPRLAKVFNIDNFDNINIIGFTGYDSQEDDIDGIHFAKVFENRRISNSLVMPKIYI